MPTYCCQIAFTETIPTGQDERLQWKSSKEKPNSTAFKISEILWSVDNKHAVFVFNATNLDNAQTILDTIKGKGVVFQARSPLREAFQRMRSFFRWERPTSLLREAFQRISSFCDCTNLKLLSWGQIAAALCWLLAALLLVTSAFLCFENSDYIYPKAICLAAWTIFVPVYFLSEYALLWRNNGIYSEERLKQIPLDTNEPDKYKDAVKNAVKNGIESYKEPRDLARNCWLAIASVLAMFFFGKEIMKTPPLPPPDVASIVSQANSLKARAILVDESLKTVNSLKSFTNENAETLGRLSAEVESVRTELDDFHTKTQALEESLNSIKSGNKLLDRIDELKRSTAALKKTVEEYLKVHPGK
jgi:hypothetical protein